MQNSGMKKKRNSKQLERKVNKIIDFPKTKELSDK